MAVANATNPLTHTTEGWKMTIIVPRWLFVAGLLAAGISVLGLYSPSGSAQQATPLPFANAVEQRTEMIRELQAIKALLKEQNDLIRQATLPEDAKPKP